MAKSKSAKKGAVPAGAQVPDKAVSKPVKAATKVVKPSKPNIFSRIGRYFGDVRSEMTRVVWPTRPEVVSASGIVIMTLIIFIILILVFDELSFQIVRVLGLIGG